MLTQDFYETAPRIWRLPRYFRDVVGVRTKGEGGVVDDRAAHPMH